MTALTLELVRFGDRRPRSAVRAAAFATVLTALLAAGLVTLSPHQRTMPLDRPTRTAFTRIAQQFASETAYGDAHPSASVYRDLPWACADLDVCAVSGHDDPIVYFLVLSGDFTCYACSGSNSHARESMQARTIVATVHRYAVGGLRVSDVGVTGRRPDWGRIGAGVTLP